MGKRRKKALLPMIVQALDVALHDALRFFHALRDIVFITGECRAYIGRGAAAAGHAEGREASGICHEGGKGRGAAGSRNLSG